MKNEYKSPFIQPDEIKYNRGDKVIILTNPGQMKTARGSIGEVLRLGPNPCTYIIGINKKEILLSRKHLKLSSRNVNIEEALAKADILKEKHGFEFYRLLGERLVNHFGKDADKTIIGDAILEIYSELEGGEE